MPPKKKGQKTNKKKKGSQGRSSGSGGGSSATPSASQNGRTAGSAFVGSPFNMNGFQRRNPIHPDEYPTVYRRYKDATKRFFACMEKQALAAGVLLPSSSECTKTFMSVNTLIIIADHMENEQCTIDPMALKDLKLTIQIRTRVAKSMFEGGDSGHKHFLTVLKFCRTVLVKLPTEATHDYNNDVDVVELTSSRTGGRQHNRFEVFQAGEDEDAELDDDDDVEVFPSSVPRPDPEPEPMSLDDLMNSDERHDAILFLLSMDEIMDAVVQQYQAVLLNHRQNIAQDFPVSNIVETLMEAAVATNMAIQQVQRLDMELSLQYPYLTTPYRLLSIVNFPETTDRVAAILSEHASKRVVNRDISIFLGDCMECAFRSASDPLNRLEFMVPEFCSEYQLDSTGADKLRKIVEVLRTSTMFEVPFAPEINLNKSVLAQLLECSPSYKSHSWLANMPNISGGRAIHHTIRLLQSFGWVIENTGENKQFFLTKGYFGPSPWVPGKSSKIAGDMDELLMTDILPQFISMFRHGIWGKMELPMMDDIAPLWLNLRNYVRHPEKAVSWPLAFSVHAMLTAILETDSITDSLMTTSDTTFHNFFHQVEWANSLLHDDSSIEYKSFQNNLNVVMLLENLGLPSFGRRAIWNPLFAGTSFSYLTYFGNMEAGCSMVDHHAQLIVMFLYHGLILNGIIESGGIPFLDVLYTSFKKSRAVWGG